VAVARRVFSECSLRIGILCFVGGTRKRGACNYDCANGRAVARGLCRGSREGRRECGAQHTSSEPLAGTKRRLRAARDHMETQTQKQVVHSNTRAGCDDGPPMVCTESAPKRGQRHKRQNTKAWLTKLAMPTKKAKRVQEPP